jgi:acyl-CoA reductase-like NAD-dependent aldehyde dehydrogenase
MKIPALRFGQEYHSLSQHKVVDLGTGETLATLGLVQENLIAVDCGRGGKMKKAFEILQKIPIEERIRMCVLAGKIFSQDSLEMGGDLLSIEDYHRLLARTSGLPLTLARKNTSRIVSAFEMMGDIVSGLSRGMPYEVFDNGIGTQHGTTVRLTHRAKCLASCMPNNSPGVHVVWLPSLAFGIPVLIRPGSSEPLTPYRLVQAFIKAGFPKEAFAFYPCDHAAANRIPELTGAAIVFGSDETVNRWKNNPAVEIHGSGFSKLFVGPDLMLDWQKYIPTIAENVYTNSGRSCFTVSVIVVPSNGREFAEALACEMSPIVPRPDEDPLAKLSAMAMPDAARRVNETIDAGLKSGGAFDMSAAHQPSGRLIVFEGRTYLLPSVIFCDTMDHVLAKKEFLFPYVAVVEASMNEAFEKMGPTLSLAVYSNDEGLIRRATQSDVNLVSINESTSQLDRKQPHEGNLFDVLFTRKSCVRS